MEVQRGSVKQFGRLIVNPMTFNLLVLRLEYHQGLVTGQFSLVKFDKCAPSFKGSNAYMPIVAADADCSYFPVLFERRNLEFGLGKSVTGQIYNPIVLVARGYQEVGKVQISCYHLLFYIYYSLIGRIEHSQDYVFVERNGNQVLILGLPEELADRRIQFHYVLDVARSEMYGLHSSVRQPNKHNVVHLIPGQCQYWLSETHPVCLTQRSVPNIID